MLIQSQLLNEYLRTCHVFKFLLGNSGTWNAYKTSFKINRNPYIFSFILSLFYSISLISSLIIGSFRFESRLYSSIAAILIPMQLFISHCSWTITSNTESLENLFTAMIVFEKRHAQGSEGVYLRKSNAVVAARIVMKYLREWSVYCFPAVAAGVAIMMPQVPLNILGYPPGSWLIGTVGSCKMKTVILLGVNAVNWYLLVKQGMLVVFSILIGALGLVLALQLFLRNSKMILESAYYDDITRNREIPKLTGIYRQIEIMTKCYNKIFSGPLVSMLLLVIIGEVLVAVELTKFTKHATSALESRSSTLEKYAALGFYITIMLNGIFVMNLLYGVCANVHDISRKTHTKLTSILVFKNTSYMVSYRKVVASLQIVKVNFGRTSNFIEKLTPVVYQDYTLKRFVDALLMS